MAGEEPVRLRLRSWQRRGAGGRGVREPLRPDERLRVDIDHIDGKGQ